MKELSLENQIYFCKYHDVDTALPTTIGVKENEIEPLLNQFKEMGVYKKYRNLDEYEYEKIIKAEKRRKKEKKMEENNLMDLNKYLFAELKKLTSENITQEELDTELKISKQVVSVSQTIINNASLLFQAQKHFEETAKKNSEVAALLRLDKGK